MALWFAEIMSHSTNVTYGIYNNGHVCVQIVELFSQNDFNEVVQIKKKVEKIVVAIVKKQILLSFVRVLLKNRKIPQNNFGIVKLQYVVF